MRKGRRAVHENTLCSTGGTGYAEDGGQILPFAISATSQMVLTIYDKPRCYLA